MCPYVYVYDTCLISNVDTEFAHENDEAITERKKQDRTVYREQIACVVYN